MTEAIANDDNFILEQSIWKMKLPLGHSPKNTVPR